MGIGKLIKKHLCHACVCFTLITAVYMLIMLLIYPEDEAVLVEASSIILFFVFSVFFGMANTILSIDAIPSALRYVLHYIICIFAFYTCLILPYSSTVGAAVVICIAFSFLYAIVMVVIGIFRAKLKKNREATATYTKQFSKKK